MKQERSWTEIDLSFYDDNIAQLKKHLSDNTTFMQIVKADAYGHGAYQIAQRARQNGAVYLGVANYQEALLLRYQKIDMPILILSPSLPDEIYPIIENNLTPTVSDLNFAEKLNIASGLKERKTKIHLNIDTGMGRSGIYYQKANQFVDKIREMKNLVIEGIFSHFAASENDREYSYLQSERFKTILEQLNFKPTYIHISNSSGVVNIKTNYANLVRIGLLSFGVYTSDSIKKKIDLKQVMSFKTRISQIRFAYPGDSIGYNRTYTVKKKTKYAVLPVGYADGYDFLLSNRGKVFIKQKICNVIGKVSMDMITVDISKLDNARIGDEVILLGNQHNTITADILTKQFGGLSYELLCQVGRRAKRYYKDKTGIISSAPLLRRDFVSSDYSDDKLTDIIETAIEQRLQSKEIANLIYNDILQRFFKEKDSDIYYRKDFEHHIKFEKAENNLEDKYYKVKTQLKFTKILNNTFFYVACAKSEQQLEKFFLQKEVEYRWLLDSIVPLSSKYFKVDSVTINDKKLHYTTKLDNNCIIINCFHDYLKDLVGTEVNFSIATETYYPKDSHQLGIYINEPTKNIDIVFEYDALLKKVEVVPIFAGQRKFPHIQKQEDKIRVSSDKNEWIFPNSGIVFAY